MESFFLAETTKYLYLLFDTDNFIHNQGQYGTVIETPHGECIIDAGGYIFNTEAHPIDPGALYCCSAIPNIKLYDINKLNSNRRLFRGDSIDERRHRVFNEKEQEKKQEINQKEEVVQVEDVVKVEEQPVVEKPKKKLSDEEIKEIVDNFYNAKHEENVEITTPGEIQTVSNIEASENESHRDSEEVLFDGSFKILPEFVNQFLNQNIRPKFDPQMMLERLRTDNKYPHNATWENSHQLMSCEAQPFMQRMSIMGEFFNS